MSRKLEKFEKIRKWGKEKGILPFGDAKTQTLKLAEEAGEVARAVINQDLPEIKDGIGDCVVVLTLLADMCDMTIEECIDSAYEVIANRTGKIKNGSFIKDE